MKNNNYITNKNKGKINMINPKFFRRNMKETKKLYDPNYGDIDKPKYQLTNLNKIIMIFMMIMIIIMILIQQEIISNLNKY